VSKTASWLIKSFLIGVAAGLAAFAVSYAFLMVHQEVGIRPAFSWQVALAAFVSGTIVALIYFRMKSEP
jgi:RsiW-degrading membrane proteinase PrsW (M82 family)